MSRRARVDDLTDIALALPHTTEVPGFGGRPAYRVNGKLFCAFRSPRPDAVDPETGARLDDVILVWTPDEQDKLSLAQADGPWFTTPHFDGSSIILIRAAHLGQITVAELTEMITDAWRCRASAAMVRRWEAAR